MAGKQGRSGGARKGSGRKPNAWYVEHGLVPGSLGVSKPAKAPTWTPPVRPCCVYVVHEVGDDSVCKIGIAQNPGKRLSALQVAHHRELKLAFSLRLRTDAEALSVEQAVHKLFEDKHCRGEWYRVCALEAMDAIQALSAEQESREHEKEV
jgi:hypothetical protein